LERPTACDASKDRGGGKGGGDDSATFIIKSRLLAFTPRRNGEIKDPRHYTVAHRAMLTFKIYLDERERGRKRKTLDVAPPTSCSKLWRGAPRYYGWKLTYGSTVLLNHRIMENAHCGLTAAY